MLGIEKCTKEKGNHNGVRPRPEMAAILYIISPDRIPQYVVVRRLNSFSTQTDPAEYKILENWSQLWH